MIVNQAKEIARQWVIEEGGRLPGFSGAFLAGSILWLPDDATLPPSSDVDISIVLADPPSNKLGKFRYQGIILEVWYTSENELQSPEMILGQSHMAGSFRLPNILADPSGRLTALQAAVARDYAKRLWVRRRCEHARDKALGMLQSVSESALFHDQFTTWLYGTSVMTHMLLVAGLRNPTVRRRYLATRELLAEYGRLDFYEAMLELLGCAGISQGRVRQRLAAVAEALDSAKTWIKTPYRFASDISDVGRSIAVDGSRELIERGDHREAVFYLLATYSRCQHVLYVDAPAEVQERCSVGYRQFAADLGIISFADLARRCQESERFLPRVWEVAEAIMARNPEIKD